MGRPVPSSMANPSHEETEQPIMPATKRTPTNRAAVLSAFQALIDGTTKNKPALPPSFPVGAQTYKPDDVIAMLQKLITLGQAVVTAEAALAAAVKAYGDELALTQLVVGTFRKLVILLFSGAPDVLATFGLEPPKPRSSTAATKAGAAAKGAAKRKAKKAAVDAVDAASSATTTSTTAQAATIPAAAPAPTPVVAPVVKPAS